MMKLAAISIVILAVAIVLTHLRIELVERQVHRLQSCVHGVAVMAADGKSSVSVCQP